MLKTERAKLIKQKLDELYPNTPIPLTHKNTFQLLIAVLLSAQCTDKRVNEVTPKLFKIAPTAVRMQKLSEKKIYDIIRPCGLGPKKSKAILALSHILVNEYKGLVPAQIELIEALPGVGHKTASVVISQGFGNPAFPVDTHIHRLAQRWGLTKGNNVMQTEKDLKSLFHQDSWNKLHLQIIFYGREYCTARGCDGTICEICTACFPNRRKAIKINKT